jgi:hypothetical protein
MCALLVLSVSESFALYISLSLSLSLSLSFSLSLTLCIYISIYICIPPWICSYLQLGHGCKNIFALFVGVFVQPTQLKTTTIRQRSDTCLKLLR